MMENRGRENRGKEKTDRRVRKTRALLWHGLATLMLTRDINEISVKDLTEFVDINRSTFYAHYKDIHMLLSSIENELMEDFGRIISMDPDLSGSGPDALPILNALYTNLAKHRDLVSAFLGPHGDLAFIDRLQNLLSERLQALGLKTGTPPEKTAYYSSFCFSGCVGLIKEWIRNNYEPSPGEMASLTNQFLVHGLGLP